MSESRGSFSIWLLVTLSPQGRTFTLGLCVFVTLLKKNLESTLNPFGSLAKWR